MLMSLAMQMSKKDATTAISVFEAALADGPITGNADSFVFVPDTAGNVTNPWLSLRPADFDLSRPGRRPFGTDGHGIRGGRRAQAGSGEELCL
mgnify:CR=1 FL=1